jgi:hypothetical protein
MTIEDVKQMANNSQLKFTKKIKSLLTAEAAKYGIEIPNCACRNKWSDLLLQLYAAKNKEAKLAPKFKYLKNYTTISGGVYYNEATDPNKIEQLRRTNPLLFTKLYRAL